MDVMHPCSLQIDTRASKRNREEDSEPKLPVDMTYFSGAKSAHAFGIEQRLSFWTPAASSERP